MKVKKICALTMVRNDEFNLLKWVEYYGHELGKENLYIYFDGTDQEIPDFCAGCNAELRQRNPGMVVKSEKIRLSFLSEKAAELMRNGYDIVIGTDADEYLVVDPNVGLGLKEYLSGLDIKDSVSGLGIDIGQKLGEEDVISKDRPYFEQRRYGYLCSRYTKPSVISSPVSWGSGFHRIKGHDFHIDNNLFLFHTGSIDLKMIEDRMRDNDLLSTGRLKHIQKRAKTIYVVSRAKIREWDRTVKVVRWIQQHIRPVNAWNKPWDPVNKVVVRIPDRFVGIL
jgi:hypothetical protein